MSQTRLQALGWLHVQAGMLAVWLLWFYPQPALEFVVLWLAFMQRGDTLSLLGCSWGKWGAGGSDTPRLSATLI